MQPCPRSGGPFPRRCLLSGGVQITHRPRWTIGADRKVYSDQEFALILRKAAELARSSEAGGDSSAGLTLDDMKAAAAEAGFDPVLVERAARLLPTSASPSIFERLIGGPVRLDREASFPKGLDEEGAARLLSAVRLRSGAGRPGTGESSPVGMSWHASGEGSSVLVNAHAEPEGTRVAVTVDRSSGLLLTSVGTMLGVFAAFMAAMATAQETAISPYLVLGTGVAGSLALARAYWAASSRRFRRELGDLMDTIQRTLGGEREEPPV